MSEQSQLEISKCKKVISKKGKSQRVKGNWKKDEDILLMKLVRENGARNWSKIAEHFENRVGKQCRERWHNHLNPAINKKKWTEQEEAILLVTHQRFGNKWAMISTFLTGRTDNCIKNHWNSTMKRKLRNNYFLNYPLEELRTHLFGNEPSKIENKKNESISKNKLKFEDSKDSLFVLDQPVETIPQDKPNNHEVHGVNQMEDWLRDMVEGFDEEQTYEFQTYLLSLKVNLDNLLKLFVSKKNTFIPLDNTIKDTVYGNLNLLSKICSKNLWSLMKSVLQSINMSIPAAIPSSNSLLNKRAHFNESNLKNYSSIEKIDISNNLNLLPENKLEQNLKDALDCKIQKMEKEKDRSYQLNKLINSFQHKKVSQFSKMNMNKNIISKNIFNQENFTSVSKPNTNTNLNTNQNMMISQTALGKFLNDFNPSKKSFFNFSCQKSIKNKSQIIQPIFRNLYQKENKNQLKMKNNLTHLDSSKLFTKSPFVINLNNKFEKIMKDKENNQNINLISDLKNTELWEQSDDLDMRSQVVSVSDTEKIDSTNLQIPPKNSFPFKEVQTETKKNITPLFIPTINPFNLNTPNNNNTYKNSSIFNSSSKINTNFIFKEMKNMKNLEEIPDMKSKLNTSRKNEYAHEDENKENQNFNDVQRD